MSTGRVGVLRPVVGFCLLPDCSHRTFILPRRVVRSMMGDIEQPPAGHFHALATPKPEAGDTCWGTRPRRGRGEE